MLAKKNVCIIKEIGTDLLVVILVLVLSGCSFALDRSITKEVNEEELVTSVSKIVDEQLDVVSPYIDDFSKDIVVDDITGEKVVTGALLEENGKEYLEFDYYVAVDTSQDLDEIANRAKALIPDSEAYQIDEKLNQTRAILTRDIYSLSRAIPPSQQAAFQKDLRQLVTRSFVLFTAGIVYMFMPNTIFWGKVSAAAAISVAAGVFANTVMSLYEYYKYGGDSEESFAQWVNEISTEPQISYALAKSMIAVGLTMERSPVVTGIMICVFSMYQVIDMVKPMLKKYDFSI
ncbi:MAG: hypothetical protein ACPKM0_08075 [Pleomorphochaeta sp.]